MKEFCSPLHPVKARGAYAMPAFFTPHTKGRHDCARSLAAIHSSATSAPFASQRSGIFCRGNLDVRGRYAESRGHGPHSDLRRGYDRTGDTGSASVAGTCSGCVCGGCWDGWNNHGVGKCLKAEFPGIKVYPVEPAESPTLSTGYKVGAHRIQGISDEFIPSILKLDTRPMQRPGHAFDAKSSC